jgi:MFS family permease
MQYYLSDVIGPDFSLHLPGGEHVVIASNPESAISFLNICAQVITTPLSPIGGMLADKYDRPTICSATVTITSICIAVTACTSSYTVVLSMAMVQGASGALGGGANYALMADAVAGSGNSSNAARDFTILLTLANNLSGVIVPTLCGSLVTVFSERELGYRIFWGTASLFCLLSVPVLFFQVRPALARSAEAAHDR